MRAHAVVAAACSRCALALHLLFVSPSFTALLSLVEVVTRGRRIESTNLTKAHAIHEGPTDLLLRTTGKEKQDNHNRKRKRERRVTLGEAESTSAMRADSLHGDRR